MSDTQKKSFGDFISNASDEEKARVYGDVMKRATERQNAAPQASPMGDSNTATETGHKPAGAASEREITVPNPISWSAGISKNAAPQEPESATTGSVTSAPGLPADAAPDCLICRGSGHTQSTDGFGVLREWPCPCTWHL